MISKFFIYRPIFASVISILIVILGAASYFTLPVEQYPELAPPVVRVDARYPGANAQTIADTVAAPIEQEVNGVDRMIYMDSTSADGLYSLSVSFQPGTNVDIASVLVQNRVNIALPRTPDDVRRQGVTTTKQSTALVGVVTLFSPDGRYDDTFLSNYLSINMRDPFSRIPGVGAASIIPAKDYGMRVWLDPQRLRQRGITMSDVNNAIRSQNVQVAAGVIGRQPVPTGQATELTVTTQGRLSEPEQFGAIVIKSEEGRIVRIRDVARVERGSRDYSTLASFNGKPACVMPIYQLPGANLVETARLCSLELDRLKKNLPPGVEASFFYDSSMFIRASLHEVFTTLFEAFVLVFLVVLVFLQSFRTTLIPMLVIPVALIGSFVFMAALGFSVNTLTMFGLVLAIGIVVDDAIVVVENVERVSAENPGMDIPHATEKAMTQITGAVVAITLVLMSVFLPAAALPGITGTMFRQFALTIAVSTLLSAVCALTLAPALCAVFLAPHDPHHLQARSAFRKVIAFPATAFNWAFDRAASAYGFLTRWLCRLSPITLAGFVFVLVVTFTGYSRIPTGFVPDEDLGFVVVAAQLPDAASLERSQAVIRRVAEEARQVEGVANVVSLAGFSVLDGQGPTYANAWIVLKPWNERVPHGRTVQAIMQDLTHRTAAMQEAQFLVFSLPAIPGLGNASGFDLRLQDQNNLGRNAMASAVNELLDAARGQTKLAVAFSSYRPGVPQVYLDIDRERALKFDVPLSGIFETLQTALGSTYVNDFNAFNRTYQVNTQADARFRASDQDILRYDARAADGQMVPLGSLVKLERTVGPDRVTRFNLYPSAQINGIPARGTSSGEALRIMEGAAADKLPAGVGYEWTGMSYQEKRTGGQGGAVFALGVLVVYLILAAQYESWTAPLSVVLTIPLVVLGAVVALTYTGLDNNLFTQIGLVLLVGLGAKNAILIVEFARQNRAHGLGIVESAVVAAKTRLRPILMTSFAFVLGVVPLVTATGAGAASRRALGTAVFGGMLGVTILSLLFTPALYTTITYLSEKTAALFRRNRTNPPGRTPPAPSSAPASNGHAATPSPAVSSH